MSSIKKRRLNTADPTQAIWNEQIAAVTTETSAYRLADNFIGAYPEQKDFVVSFLCDQYSRSRYEVIQEIANAGDLDADLLQKDHAIARLAPKQECESTLQDVFPSPLAEILDRSSDKTNTNPWVEGSAVLVAVAGLIGSRVMVRTKFKSRKPIPGNLNLDVAGDSSASKSISMDKVMDPMLEVRKLFYREQSKAFETLSAKADMEPEKRKAAKQKILDNKEELMMTPDSFSAEALIKDICKQSPRSGIILHMDEGSNMLQNEQYAGSGSSSNGSSGSSNGLYKQMILKAQLSPLEGPALQRVDPERGGMYRSQTFSSSANIQMAFLPKLFAFDEDSHGWTSRHIFVEAGSKIEDDGYEILAEDDELSVFMTERLIPFMQSLRPSSVVDADGKVIDEGHIVLEFSDDDGAQNLYSEYCRNLLTTAASLAKDNIEPAWATYLKKGSIRVGKFALLLHLISQIKGAQRTDASGNHVSNDNYDEPAKGWEFKDVLFSSLTYDNALKRVNTPIPISIIRRAIALEIFYQSQFQKISDICRYAPAVKQEAIEDGKHYQRCQVVLNKLRDHESVDVKESEIKRSLKGRGGLTNKEITNCIKILEANGCIRRVKSGQTFTLQYVKPIRY